MTVRVSVHASQFILALILRFVAIDSMTTATADQTKIVFVHPVRLLNASLANPAFVAMAKQSAFLMVLVLGFVYP
jgi:hypothetical protein